MLSPNSGAALPDTPSLTRDSVPLLRPDEYPDGGESVNGRDSAHSSSFELVDPASEQTTWQSGHSWMSEMMARGRRSRCKRSAKARPRPRRLIWYLLLVTFVILGVVQFVSLSFLTLSAILPNQAAYFASRWGDPGSASKRLLHWPTDFSRDIQPVPCHSHNDYWRAVPLYDAIQAGCISVEADVWLVEDDLFVGHSQASLTANRTLESLYINPLLDILAKQNPMPNFNSDPLSVPHGIFDTDAAQTLVLLIDFKTDGPILWPHVESELEPLRQRGYLTHFDGGSVIERPITAVATGNAPFDLLIANATYRDIFFDAPLDQLALQRAQDTFASAPTQGSTYNATNSYYASTSFQKAIGSVWSDTDSSQLEKIRAQISTAHKRGLKARYWETPSWPRGLRNHIWGILVKEGVDILNVDDLEAATRGEWGKWG